MSVEELRDEARRLVRDDVPYAKYIRAVNVAADEAWPKLKESEQAAFKVHVYWNLVDGLRLFTGNFVLPQNLRDVPFDPKFSGAMELASAMETLKLDKETKAFYAEVFASESFQKSPSAFREAVIDLWKRYEKAGGAVPYYHLVTLNQPGMGDPRGSTSWTNELALGRMYADLGEHATAAAWYAKVPPDGLGPLKAADELFIAGRHDDAAAQYRDVLAHLDDWAAKQPRLRFSALAAPLQSADLAQVKKHVEERLAEIKRLKGER